MTSARVPALMLASCASATFLAASACSFFAIVSGLSMRTRTALAATSWPRTTGISATRPSTRAAMSNRVASTSPCTRRGCGRTRYQIDRPTIAAMTRPKMSNGRRLGGARRLAASLSSLTGSPPRGFAASVRVSGISPRAARATGVSASGIGRFLVGSRRAFALSSRASRYLDRGDQALGAAWEVYDEPAAIAPIAQRATQDGHMDRKVCRLPRIRRATQCRTLVEIAHRSLRVRQAVRDQGITRWRHHEVMAAGHDDHILLSILLIDDRRGLAAGGEHVTPQDLAGLDVDRLDQIVGRRRDEDQAARRDDRPSIIRSTDLERNEGGHAERTVPPSRTERTIPQRFAGREIDSADAAIRRPRAEHAGRHLPSRVDKDAVGRSRHRTRALGTRGASSRTRIAGREQAHRVRLLAGHEHVVVRHVVVVRDDYPALGINGNAAPVRSPVVARIFDVMAAELRRGVRALITSALEVDPANHLINRRDTPHIALDQIGLA